MKNPIPDKVLLETAKDEISESWLQIDNHHLDGEDSFLSIAESFPHGIQDLVFVIFNKARRIIGYQIKGNYRKVREELQDIINYSAFALAFLRIEWIDVKVDTKIDEGLADPLFYQTRSTDEISTNPPNPPP